jgi:tyrosyl-tRNA synthetase
VGSASLASTAEQLTRIRRGTADIITESELRAKLDGGVPLRVKLGLDPTAPDLHLGHTVVLQKLRDFQDLGHEVIIVVGDFTAMIGDPTGRSDTRKQLTSEEIRANAETYRTQLSAVLDMARTRVDFNSSWLSTLGFADVIREAACLTVAQMLQREDFAARYTSGRPISLHEFLYPIAQGYDSVALRADVELGGTDQTFNLLIGRDLQRAHGQTPQVTLTVPILPGLDGVQKMSKSLGNAIGLTESPGDVYGKLMSISDDLMWLYFDLLTRTPEAELEALRAGHPMDAKKRLAFTVTAQYGGPRAAEDAAARFSRVHQQRARPLEIERMAVTTPTEGIALPWLLKQAGLVRSTSDGRRLIEQGAVEVDDRRVTDVREEVAAGGEYLVRVGKRRFSRVAVVTRPEREKGLDTPAPRE